MSCLLTYISIAFFPFTPLTFMKCFIVFYLSRFCILLFAGFCKALCHPFNTNIFFFHMSRFSQMTCVLWTQKVLKSTTLDVHLFSSEGQSACFECFVSQGRSAHVFYLFYSDSLQHSSSCSSHSVSLCALDLWLYNGLQQRAWPVLLQFLPVVCVCDVRSHLAVFLVLCAMNRSQLRTRSESA